ncbi:MAG: DNA polymerase III subunit gamma/tau, partial [Novosphingobium sp.]
MADSTDMFGDPPQEEENKPSAADLEAAGQSSMFGDPAPVAAPVAPAPAPAPAEVVRESAPPPPVAPAAQPYRVLARKYRSQTFAELIGQEAMVRTLAN